MAISAPPPNKTIETLDKVTKALNKRVPINLGDVIGRIIPAVTDTIRVTTDVGTPKRRGTRYFFPSDELVRVQLANGGYVQLADGSYTILTNRFTIPEKNTIYFDEFFFATDDQDPIPVDGRRVQLANGGFVELSDRTFVLLSERVIEFVGRRVQLADGSFAELANGGYVLLADETKRYGRVQLADASYLELADGTFVEIPIE